MSTHFCALSITKPNHNHRVTRHEPPDNPHEASLTHLEAGIVRLQVVRLALLAVWGRGVETQQVHGPRLMQPGTATQLRPRKKTVIPRQIAGVEALGTCAQETQTLNVGAL